MADKTQYVSQWASAKAIRKELGLERDNGPKDDEWLKKKEKVREICKNCRNIDFLTQIEREELYLEISQKAGVDIKYADWFARKYFVVQVQYHGSPHEQIVGSLSSEASSSGIESASPDAGRESENENSTVANVEDNQQNRDYWNIVLDTQQNQ